MFNISKQSKVLPTEKYLREENIVQQTDVDQPITEKKLPHREGEKYTTTEEQMNGGNKKADVGQIIEKVLNDIDGKYVDHRKDVGILTIPPINDLVEKTRQKRLSEYDSKGESHWSLDFDDKEQNGSLPKWPKIRMKHRNAYETEQWNESHPEAENIIDNVTKADLDRVTQAIKTGQTVEYDKAIIAILRDADQEQRDLTSVERQTITNLKIARTNFLLTRTPASNG